MTHYDVIIIGTGAGGGTLADHLAPSGKRILLIERGDYVRREKDKRRGQPKADHHGQRPQGWRSYSCSDAARAQQCRLR
jgi:choline dehydrogenase-like flavoprotein